MGIAKCVAQLFEIWQHFLAPRQVERRQRFVEQQQPRLRQQRATQRHALLFAARQLVRPAREQCRRAPAVSTTSSNRSARRRARGRRRAPYSQVAAHRQVRKQPRVLEHHADAPLARIDHEVPLACRPGRRRRAARGPRPARSRPAISEISVDLPQPERPNSAVTPGVGAPNAASSANSPRLLAEFDAQHQRPSRRRRRAREQFRDQQPGEPEREGDACARRAASASPSGVCSAVYSASGSVRVSPGMFEAKVITAPNSPRPAANAVTRARQDAGRDQRQRDGEEPVDRAGAQRARRLLQPAVDVLERNADGAHHQREGHDRSGERGAGAGERELDAEVARAASRRCGPRTPNSTSSR